MEEKIRLSVYGITYNQVQSGAYALILSEDGGQMRLPVVIGAAEAQSIAAHLKRVSLPRPLTHDLMVSVARAFGIAMKEIFIYRFDEGIFYSEITFDDGEREVKIDSRTSDAVALAVRTGASIYTTAGILQKTGFLMDEEAKRVEEKPDSVSDGRSIPLERLAVEELERMLQRSIRKEEYERAAEIKGLIDRKKELHQDDNNR